jgi:uncharacterized protein YndB with AHSA1/START domain
MGEVERRVDFDAGADEVWDALTDEDLLGEWFDGRVALRLEPGGVLRVEGDDGVREARVETVEPARRLTFTWFADEGAPASTVELELCPQAGGCTLHVRERLVDEAADPIAEPFPIGFRAPVRAPRQGDALALAR